MPVGIYVKSILANSESWKLWNSEIGKFWNFTVRQILREIKLCNFIDFRKVVGSNPYLGMENIFFFNFHIDAP